MLSQENLELEANLDYKVRSSLDKQEGLNKRRKEEREAGREKGRRKKRRKEFKSQANTDVY